MTDTVSHLPDLSVVLDLDAYERPEEDIKPPFVVKVEGRKITFNDPAEIDWQVLASVEVPADLFSVSMSREDRLFFRGLKMPTHKFTKLMQAYYEHYDFEEKIRAAKRQSAFA